MPTGDYSKTKEFKEYQRQRMKNMWKDPTSIFNSKQYRAKLGKANSGENHYFFGQHHSKKEREKRRVALLGEKNHFFGKHHTTKSKLKNSITKKLQWKDPNSAYNTPEYRKNRKEVMLHACKFIKFEDTKPELEIKEILDNNKINYEKQQWFGPYRVDFLISQKNLIVEVYGQWTHGDPRFFKSTDIIQGHRIAKDKWKYDKQRDKYLKSLGYNIIHFWEYDIKKNKNNIKNKLMKYLI